MDFDISVIIPTYNVERYIQEALNSIVKQTFDGEIEIIIIDDCSTDNTPKLIEEFKKNHNNLEIKLLYQERNMRQGTARNRGIREARGKYVFFLDGDDFIDFTGFDKLYKKAEAGSCDMVLCDWAYYYEDRGLVYVNNDLFLYQDFLYGKESEQLFQAITYFSVNKLYSREFLINNNIKFGEGYIYEDFEFYLNVAQKANVVGIISNPLYKVRVNEYSTTKTNTNSTEHVNSYLKAVQNSIKLFNPRGDESYYHVYKHLIQKTIYYSKERAPFGHKRKTLRKVLNILNQKSTNYHVPLNIIPLNHFFFRRKYVQKGKVSLILMVNWLQSKGKLVKIFKFAQKGKQKILNNIIIKKYRKTNLYKKQKRKKLKLTIDKYYKQPLKQNTILFLGFDYRYVGNSKYFFDYLIKKDSYLNVFFVTKDNNVPSEYRINPRSLKFYEKLASAKVVIAESWVPLDFRKRDEAKWIQLWHGTPFKKLLFDSHEYHISKFNRNHKRQKQKDISKWDYILSDSSKAKDKFASAFAIDNEKIINNGYPRVQWLKDNQKNEVLKSEIKLNLNIPEDKKVILYVPTWRDYNYKIQVPDISYLLDINFLGEGLQNEYVFLNKQHSMGNIRNEESEFIIIPNKNIEVQELILISDIIISDYSSIIFDGMAIDKKFYLYINDFDKYAKARGVYEDLNDLLKVFYVSDVEELIYKIKEIEKVYPMENYKEVQSLYSNINNNDSNKNLYNKIIELISN
ncbi:CDP-glycerol glycerophosphotransferase [Cytobacillus horneckiae]|uniref:bifunctional glycosyltransferase/CDP-glycerol:glycerophosphate glycerophosphotransferase n=1 Tax=Cytobacillus horneckiae TaxID=549687 RepID=UPI0019D2F46E|nr:CDP-glycerol glycerophosphotransferase family protein [Cytobacillus horneckiae]MBN6885241.1 CDP-glycerol glycerophosphotransferase family protein [Cytobacillus horneckiae]